jgi:hypothetical protein
LEEQIHADVGETFSSNTSDDGTTLGIFLGQAVGDAPHNKVMRDTMASGFFSRVLLHDESVFD